MREKLQLTGTILLIGETQTFNSGFQKREFVVDTGGKYPQQIKLEVVKDNCQTLDTYRNGDAVAVDFNLRGNEYNGKYYVNLQAWRITKQGGQQPREPAPQQPAQQDNQEDEIPF